ncbi:MAG: aldo/keto reductase [Chitinispirillales bacterium]|jgi:predicted aldo/keto reductase-like oxidoreductase|nr:aldo/keto reductase [Chitinispirillales bacterium]
MQYRIDPKTGNKLSILGFGCMRFPRTRGGRIDMQKSEAMLVDAINRGVNYFDTAYIYPGSEEATGHIIAKNNLRDKVYIATKLPLFLCKTYSDFDKYLNKSLERLKTEYIDYYLMHMITTPEQWQTLCDMGMESWIDEKREEGKIKQLGFSFHGKREDFVSIIDARDWDFTMIQYNYLDINNQAGRTGLKHAASKGMPVFIMEPLLGGRLANQKMLPEKAINIMKQDSPVHTPAARALRWIWNHEEVTLLLSGMSAQNQLDENIAAANEMTSPNILPQNELEAVDKVIVVFNESNKISCTGCGYCMPCPFGVNIVDGFSSYNMSYTVGLLSAMKTHVQATAALTTKKGLAGSCNGCGKCERSCPQSIPIRQSLKAVKKRLEPFWFTSAVAVARFLTGVKAKK